jgi:DNA-binding transcriptional MerR regulator
MTTARIGSVVGYSTQQVRDLERLGVIPRAERGSNGYRRYHEEHLVALRAYRALAAAIGPVPARRLMPVLIAAPVEEAADEIDGIHATIATDRARVREALRGLETVLTDPTDVFEDRDAMTIGELADAVGVRTSALRHWEDEGLIEPDRLPIARTRRYGARAITETRIVAALRSGGYPLPPIRHVLDRLRSNGSPGEVRALLDGRLTELTRRSVALLESSSHLHALLRDRMDPPG